MQTQTNSNERTASESPLTDIDPIVRIHQRIFTRRDLHRRRRRLPLRRSLRTRLLGPIDIERLRRQRFTPLPLVADGRKVDVVRGEDLLHRVVEALFGLHGNDGGVRPLPHRSAVLLRDAFPFVYSVRLVEPLDVLLLVVPTPAPELEGVLLLLAGGSSEARWDRDDRRRTASLRLLLLRVLDG